MLVTIGTLRVKAQSFKFNFSATLENCWLLASYPGNTYPVLGTQQGILIDTLKEKTFPSFPHIIRVFIVVYTLPVLLGNIETKPSGIKIFKFPISYCRMTFKGGWINRNLTKNINQTMVTQAYMRYNRTNNSVQEICKGYINQSRGSTCHSSQDVDKLMKTVDIR